MPEPRRMPPRIDDTAGDVPTLVRLGITEPPPQPSYEGLFVEPDLPPPDDEPAA